VDARIQAAEGELSVPARQGPRIAVERSRTAAPTSRELWRGLVQFNRQNAGPLAYSRKVIGARDAKGRLLGGVILQSYWRETYVELLWLSAKARRGGLGTELIAFAEREARRRGSRIIHLNTYSFQAPAFYEKQGYTRFGALSGSPRGKSRYFYFKPLRP
jgi:GNAT superfamily N-acetyltransferase